MGRTARGGLRGESISLITPEALPRLGNIEEKISEKLEEYPFLEQEEVLKTKNKIDKTKRRVKVHFYAKGFDSKFKNLKLRKMKFTQKVREKFEQKN